MQISRTVSGQRKHFVQILPNTVWVTCSGTTCAALVEVKCAKGYQPYHNHQLSLLILTMQSFLGSYEMPGKENGLPYTSILLLDKSLKLGYKNEADLPVVEEWPLNAITAQYHRPGNESVVTLTGTRKQITVTGEALCNGIITLKAYHAQPLYRKIFTKTFYKLASVALFMITLLVGGYFLLAPWLSELLAKKLPAKYEISLGENVYGSLIKTYTVDEEKTKLAGEFLAALKFESHYPVQVTVVKNSQVNAFALPGGHIIVYSALLEKISNYSELAALLAHEYTHISKRHATRSIFRSLGSKAFISLLFGRSGMLTSLVLNNADQLKSLKYSRSLEKEADIEGLRLLKESKIDGRGFIWLMEHLAENGKQLLPEMVASHPDIEKRIRYLRENEHFIPLDSVANPELPLLFSRLKNKSDY
jgi:beta-barrel assembly-enhancing protease